MSTNDVGQATAPQSSALGFSSMELAYLKTRRFVGVVAFLLPSVLLVVGGAHRTISSYYHSALRDIFVGVICAVAIFLYFDDITTEESEEASWVPVWNNRIGNLTAFAALGVAFIPTIREGEPPNWQSYIHVAASLLLFACMIAFSLWLYCFDGIENTPGWNALHRVCGAIIIVMLVAAVFGTVLRTNIFWVESIGVMTFAVSFFFKGEGRRTRCANSFRPDHDVAGPTAISGVVTDTAEESRDLAVSV